jgi:hypothetical protein
MGVPGKKSRPEPVKRTTVVVCAAGREDHPSVVESAIQAAASDADTDGLEVDWETFERTKLTKEGTVQTPTKTLNLGAVLWAAEYTYSVVPKGGRV